MIQISDKIVAKTLDGIVADSHQIAYTKGERNESVSGTVASMLDTMSEQVYGALFDVSLFNAVRETEICLGVERETGNIILATYESLAEAIAAVPDEHKHGGITLRFANSEGKYFQYFNTKDEWSDNVADWSDMNVSDAVEAGNSNLVTSNAVSTAVGAISREVSDFEEGVREQIENYRPIEIAGDVVNAPDEEDLTSVDGLLKFKDRNTLEGMGYIILRRNKTVSEQLSMNNTIYVVQYDMNLGGDNVTIPSGSVLFFQGGSFKNGTIDVNGAEVYPRYEFLTRGADLVVQGNPAVGTHKYNVADGQDEYFDGSVWVACARKDAVDAISSDVDSIDTRLGRVETHVGHIDEALIETNATLGTAVNDVAGLKNDVVVINTQISLANGRINSVSGNTVALQDRVATDEAKISALSGETSDLRSDLELSSATLRESIAAEASARTEADEALQDEIDVLGAGEADIYEKLAEISGSTYSPDQEDITVIDGLLKFNNKEYNPAEFSGMGRIFLRKNEVDAYPNNNWMVAILPKGQGAKAYLLYSYAGKVYGVANTNTKGLILSENVVKEVSSYDKSQLVGIVDEYLSYTKSNGVFSIPLPNGETMTSTTLNGMEVLSIEDTATTKINALTQEDFPQANTLYIVQYDYDLNLNAITIPEGSAIVFYGGRFNNGRIELNGAAVYPNYGILEEGSDITITGNPKKGTYRFGENDSRPKFFNGSVWVDGEGMNLDTRVILV